MEFSNKDNRRNKEDLHIHYHQDKIVDSFANYNSEVKIDFSNGKKNYEDIYNENDESFAPSKFKSRFFKFLTYSASTIGILYLSKFNT